MRLAWTTDIHLNHVPASLRERWLGLVARQNCDGIVISGDIGESIDVVRYLRLVADAVSVPVYFVLGNHDFYGGSIGVTVQEVVRACREDDRLRYLTDLSAVPLSSSGLRESAYLVGEDGWGDATEGNFERSHVRLNDFVQIRDFCQTRRETWKQRLEDLGAASAERLAAKLLAIPIDAKQVLVVTHVPPFCEACWYEGRITDDHWAPFFVCGQVGRVLRDISRSRPTCNYSVLCGHTHHGGVADIEPNLTVYTGSACYGKPDIEAIVNISAGAVLLQDPDRPHLQ